MKINKTFFIAFLALLSATPGSHGQCIADAGPDQIVCDFWNGHDTVTLGAQPAAHSGVPPYIYAWETSITFYQGTNFSFTATASDLMDDTTLANPKLIGLGVDDFYLYLNVTDSSGNQCRDSVRIQYSNFGVTLEDKQKTINQGDSVQLYTSVGSQFHPMQVEWSPAYNLSNARAANPWASPDSTTSYVATVTDSAGCTAVDPDPFQVYVNPVSQPEYENLLPASIYPHPLRSRATLAVPASADAALSVVFYNSLGQVVKTFKFSGSEVSLRRADFDAGLFWYRISSEQHILWQGKMLVD